jgi:hypothetical protein
MSHATWIAAAQADPQGRDREALLVDAVKAGMAGSQPVWSRLEGELLRRIGYLVDLAQMMRGQTDEEASVLEGVRARLPSGPATTFWPGEMPLPASTDPVAERWGFSRGCSLQRLRTALRHRPVLLPGR